MARYLAESVVKKRFVATIGIRFGQNTHIGRIPRVRSCVPQFVSSAGEVSMILVLEVLSDVRTIRMRYLINPRYVLGWRGKGITSGVDGGMAWVTVC
jgi:hypothetical protein